MEGKRAVISFSPTKFSDNIDLYTRKTICVSIFAISFIILGHVSSVGMLALFACFFAFSKIQFRFLLESKVQKRCSAIEYSTAVDGTLIGYGSEVVDFFVEKDIVRE